MIKKYGEDDGKGGILVKMYNEVKDEEGNVTGKVVNPQYIEFDNEYEDIQTYTIKLISVDTKTGCSDTATRTIEVYPQLIPEFNNQFSLPNFNVINCLTLSCPS